MNSNDELLWKLSKATGVVISEKQARAIRKIIYDSDISRKGQSESAILNKKIRQFQKTELSTRAINCLIDSGIETVGDLIEIGKRGFEKNRNVGAKTITEIYNYLNSQGLKWD